MIKKFTLAIIFLFSLSFLGCSANHSINFNSLELSLDENISDENFKKGDSKSLKRFFGLKGSDFSDFLIYTPTNTMDVNEILVLKLNDTSNIDAIKDIIENRVDKQIETFGSYGPEQCELLEDYILKIKGNYIFYCVSNNSDDIYEIFKTALKGGDE